MVSLGQSHFAIPQWYLLKKNLFPTFDNKPIHQQKIGAPKQVLFGDNSLVICDSISKFTLKAVEKTILWLEIHRTSKKRPKYALQISEVNRACDFTKSNTPPWVFSTYFKLHKWYQNTKNITYNFPLFEKREPGKV